MLLSVYFNWSKFLHLGDPAVPYPGLVKPQECSPPPQMHIQGLVRSQSAPLPHRCTSGVRSDHRVFPSPSELDHPSTPPHKFPIKAEFIFRVGRNFGVLFISKKVLKNSISCWVPLWLNCDCFFHLACAWIMLMKYYKNWPFVHRGWQSSY